MSHQYAPFYGFIFNISLPSDSLKPLESKKCIHFPALLITIHTNLSRLTRYKLNFDGSVNFNLVTPWWNRSITLRMNGGRLLGSNIYHKPSESWSSEIHLDLGKHVFEQNLRPRNFPSFLHSEYLKYMQIHKRNSLGQAPLLTIRWALCAKTPSEVQLMIYGSGRETMDPCGGKKKNPEFCTKPNWVGRGLTCTYFRW